MIVWSICICFYAIVFKSHTKSTGAKTEFNVKWLLKVISRSRIVVTGKPTRDYISLYNNVGLPKRYKERFRPPNVWRLLSREPLRISARSYSLCWIFLPLTVRVYLYWFFTQLFSKKLHLKVSKTHRPKALKLVVFDNPTVVWCSFSREPHEYPHKQTL